MSLNVLGLKELINQYNVDAPLEEASTPPSSWYIDERIESLESQTVFTNSWVIAARIDQLQEKGQYVATNVSGEPVVLVKDEEIKAFYNVCRHHAAQVMDTGEGCARSLQCPYHGWTYKLDGTLQSTPQFRGVCNFDKSENGLIEIRVDTWENWVFVCLDNDAESLENYLGSLYKKLKPLQLHKMKFHSSVAYDLDCNWKVFVDNYLDGGYHVPFMHKGLSSALDNTKYKIETKDKYCLQSCPTTTQLNPVANTITDVRRGDDAFYYWLYPNLMINWYQGVMDLNIVQPISTNKCRVIFEYYFDDNPQNTEEFMANSIKVAHQVQVEDLDVCHSVQRGLLSRAYDTGRLSVRKEAGEHLFHQLLHQDLRSKI